MVQAAQYSDEDSIVKNSHNNAHGVVHKEDVRLLEALNPFTPNDGGVLGDLDFLDPHIFLDSLVPQYNWGPPDNPEENEKDPF